MKWELKPNGDWIAQGEKGHFLLWKEGRFWKGLYMHEVGNVVRFRLWCKTLKEIKRICQENYYWEGDL